MRGLGKLPRGCSVGLRLRAVQARDFMDPATRHHKDLVTQWAAAVWDGTPELAELQAALDGAKVRARRARVQWASVTGPSGAFLLTLQRLGWRPYSARSLLTDEGRAIDLFHMSPKAVGDVAARASERWSDRQALARADSQTAGYPIFWHALRPLLTGKKPLGWSQEHRNTLVHVISGGEWPQARQSARGLTANSH